MAWVYEIRDSNNAVAGTGKGFATNNAAIAAGRKRARELKALVRCQVAELGPWEPDKIPKSRLGKIQVNPARLTLEKRMKRLRTLNMTRSPRRRRKVLMSAARRAARRLPAAG